MLYILYIIIFFSILILIKLINNKNIFIIIFASMLVLQIIIFPKICIKAAIDGTLLFFNKVFPSLFPFIVISNIILAYDGISLYSKLFGKILCKPMRLPIECSFVLIISLLCGYPLGAKYTCELYEKEIIDFKTSERLLNIASNASPLFVVGSVGALMLNSGSLGYYLLLANALSSVFMGIIFPAKNRTSLLKKELVKRNENIGFILKDSIDTSIKTCISVGGFITIFSVLNSILSNSFLFKNTMILISSLFKVPADIISGTVLGIIEMTNGCYLISNTSSTILTKLALISFMITFSGFSIISQVYTFTYKFNFCMKKYIFRKAIQGLVSSLIVIFLYKFFINYSAISSFNYNVKATKNISIFYIITFFLLLPSLTLKIKKLFKIT